MHLSILIPVFNAEKHIINCLQSILKQEMNTECYEVIIINDGSTDHSSELISDFVKDKPNMVLVDQVNKGNAITRNRLFDLAKGIYVYCLDADDYLIPKSLKKMLDFALENQMDFVGFKSKKTISSNELDFPKSQPTFNDEIVSGLTYLTNGPLPNEEVWWYLVRRQLLADNNIRLLNIIMADVVFTYRVVLSSKRMCILSDYVHLYFQSPDSIMRTEGSLTKHKLRLANYTYELVLGLHDLIQQPQKNSIQMNSKVKEDLVLKRDYFTFFMLLRFLRFDNNTKNILSKLNELDQSDIYPFSNHVVISRCPKVLENLINVMVNKKFILVFLIQIASFFKINRFAKV